MSDLVWVESSMREGIAALPIGDSYAKVARIRLNKNARETVTETISGMRNTLNSAMRRAMADTGRTYTLETGSFVTQRGAIIVVAAVTRME